MPPQTDNSSSPHALDYFGPTPPRPKPWSPPVAQTVESWCLRQLKVHATLAWFGKSLILIGALAVLALLVYLWSAPDPTRWHHGGFDKPLYEILDPQ